MRILLTDKEDKTLIVVEATDVCYDPKLSELCIYTAYGDSYAVTDIGRSCADQAVRELYEYGKVDLTPFKSYFVSDKEDT